MAVLFGLKNIDYRYPCKQKALENITLEIGEGEIVAVLGSNGSGKSTLLNLLCGLVYPSEGTISFRGKEFTERSFKDHEFNRRFRSSVGYVFQDPEAQLFCPTVFDELIFGPLQLGLSKEDAWSRAEEIMEMMHITSLRDRPGYMLSGGEKKRVAIGAVLTLNPDALVIDEPVSGLDPRTRADLIDLIFQLNHVGKTIIIATHHLELVDHLQPRVVVLSEKHTVERTGPCSDILGDIDLLKRNNLIGEYPHLHDGVIHKHLQTGFLYHKHSYPKE